MKMTKKRLLASLRSAARRHRNLLAITTFLCFANVLSQPFLRTDLGWVDWVCIVIAVVGMAFFSLFQYFERVVVPREQRKKEALKRLQ